MPVILSKGVYGEVAQAQIPELLQQQSDQATAESRVKKSMGAFNCLKLDTGYSWKSAGNSNGWDRDTHIATRLEERETVTVALALPDSQGGLQPWAQSDNPRHRWPLSQIQLPLHEWQQAQELLGKKWLPAIEQLKSQHRFLKYLHILPLVAETKHFYQSNSGWDMERIPACAGSSDETTH